MVVQTAKRGASILITFTPPTHQGKEVVPAPRVLIADDEPRLLHIVAMYLTMEGFDVTCAPDGRAALDLLRTEPFDAAILDVMMPGCDGLEVCHRLRQDPRTELLPVVIFTSLSSDSDVERARLAGANHMITKPFSLPGLGSVIRELFAEAAALSA